MSEEYEADQYHSGAEGEEAVELPLERIAPDILRKMIEEFVTREWSELSDSRCTLDEKAEQVVHQLKERRAVIVYDCRSETWNIVPRR